MNIVLHKHNLDDLEEIIEYLTGLERSDDHQEPVDLPMTDVVAMHHWMALQALEAESTVEAGHHVRHIISLLDDADHRARMEQVLEDLNAGQLHDAEHEIEEMLAGTAEPDVVMKALMSGVALLPVPVLMILPVSGG